MRFTHSKGKLPGLVICMHGNSSDVSIFKKLLTNPKFAYSALTVELPGHGSTILDRKFSIAAIINELKSFVQTVNEPIFLFGHSLGGHLAIEIAPSIEALKGVCIMGTPPIEQPLNFEDAFNPVPEMAVLFEEEPDDSFLNAFIEKATTNSFVRDQIKEAYLKAHPNVRSGIAEAIPNNIWSNQRVIFNNLDLPKFIVHGVNDPFINLNYLKEIKAENQKNCSLKLFEHSGHYPILEEPDEFEHYFTKIITKVFAE